MTSEKVALSRPSARLGASTEITKKNRQSHRATDTFTPFGHFFERHQQKNAGKAPFCKVDAGARLFFHEKVAAPRPRARLGASTDPIKNRGEIPHCGAEFGLWIGKFRCRCIFKSCHKMRNTNGMKYQCKSKLTNPNPRLEKAAQ